MRVVGADISLTSTGLSDGKYTEVVQTSPEFGPLEARMDRIVHRVTRFTHLGSILWPDLVVIEDGAPSRGAQSEAAEILSGLRLMVRHRLWLAGIPFAMVRPTTLKKYTTGGGTATKREMVAAIDERHGTAFAAVMVKDGRYDRVDAYALAAMGYDRVGAPLAQHFPAPPPHRASLDAVRWPDLTSEGTK